MIYCPECETNLDIDEEEVDEGEVVSCPECGSDFEVITVNPIELKPVEEEEIVDDEADESEFNAALMLDMAAARIAAMSRPAIPMGMWLTMKVGKMRSERPKGTVGGVIW